MEIVQNPIAEFRNWLEEAKQVVSINPDAISLATVDENNAPDVRYVLLKNITDNGFEFFTNKYSTKAKHLFANHNASFVIYWKETGKQIRVNGTVSELSREQVVAYFNTRSRNSQIGAWASKQSSKLLSMRELEANVTAVNYDFANKEVSTPEFWTGFLLQATVIEFWQEGKDRLHERIKYFRSNINDSWQHERLYP